jgi:stage II sporulation protein P
VALFLAVAALWLVWLTGDPAAVQAGVAGLAGNAQVAMALLSLELDLPQADGLSTWDRLVLAQSALLGGEVSQPDATPAPEIPDDPAPEVSADDNPAPATTTAPDDIIPKTMVAGTSSKYVQFGSVCVYNHTDYTLDLEGLLSNAPTLTADKSGPQILIYHSHATEAYTMDGTDLYEESDSYRTLDTQQNMVRIGEEMAAIFRAAGLEVIHDTTLYDYPSYNSAYSRSAQGVAAILAEYPSIQLVLDVHRDALADDQGTIYKTVAGTVDQCAQVMMVMGSDASGQSHPNWRVNLALALEIQSALAQKWATLARPVVLRASRFNQQQSTGSILVEVGTHGNTLQEAITAARLYARTVAELMTAK